MKLYCGGKSACRRRARNSRTQTYAQVSARAGFARVSRRSEFFKRLVLIAWVALLGVITIGQGAWASSEGPELPHQAWPFEMGPAGVQGTFDRQAAQRGFQVYKEVCSACHGLKYVAFRSLADIGFTEAEVKALAGTYTFHKINDEGDVVERQGTPADHFPSPFANEQAARAANGGAFPPDLSLMINARHRGPDYVYALLTVYKETEKRVCATFDEGGHCSAYRAAGEQDEALAAEEAKALGEAHAKLKEEGKAPPPHKDSDVPHKVFACAPEGEVTECVKIGEGMHYNPYFSAGNGQIAMPQPLSDGQVTYADGTANDLRQMARDLVIFLQWAAEPEMEQRKSMGIKVMLFLLIMSILFYFAKKRVWKDVEH